MAAEMKKLCILCHGSSYDKLHTVVGMTATAASLGVEVHLFLTYGALWRVARRTLDEAEPAHDDAPVNEMYQKAIDKGLVPSLEDLLEQAREIGKVRLYACTTSIKVLQLTPEELRNVDVPMGHATFLEIAGAPDARLVVV
ncbi:DsrE/DsrF/DrsH-like family protein [Myxococcota bacterium]|nr:DsrE/DsrF/DrsH-like family protein [Myxococcota bacterium]